MRPQPRLPLRHSPEAGREASSARPEDAAQKPPLLCYSPEREICEGPAAAPAPCTAKSFFKEAPSPGSSPAVVSSPVFGIDIRKGRAGLGCDSVLIWWADFFSISRGPAARRAFNGGDSRGFFLLSPSACRPLPPAPPCGSGDPVTDR